MPTYEWKRGDERATTQGSIHDPIPRPEGEGWVQIFNYSFGKVSDAGDSPGRIVRGK